MINNITEIDKKFSRNILNFFWLISRKAIFDLCRAELEKVSLSKQPYSKRSNKEKKISDKKTSAYFLNNMRYEKNKEVDPWLRSVLIDVRHKYKSCSLISSSIKKDDLFDKKLNIPEKNLVILLVSTIFSPIFLIPIIALLFI